MLSLTFITGAGISAAAGIATFRGENSGCNGSDIAHLTSKKAWESSPEQILDYYNKRRNIALNAEPTDAHYLIKQLESYYKVNIITQNVDDLHERAGSTNVIHLHGEIMKARCSVNGQEVQPQHSDLTIKDKSSNGYQLRPDVVLFGEPVMDMSKAKKICANSDILVIIGTSLIVQPAATLPLLTSKGCQKFYIDPSPQYHYPSIQNIQAKAYPGLWDVIGQIAKH